MHRRPRPPSSAAWRSARSSWSCCCRGCGPGYDARPAPGRLRAAMRTGVLTVGEGVADAGVLLRSGRPSVIVGSVGYLGFDLAALAATYAAFGGGLPVGGLLFGYVVGQLGGLVPVPGGLGGTDGGLVGGLVLVGAPLSQAAAGVLAYRAFPARSSGAARLGRLRPSCAAPCAGPPRRPCCAHRSPSRFLSLHCPRSDESLADERCRALDAPQAARASAPGVPRRAGGLVPAAGVGADAGAVGARRADPPGPSQVQAGEPPGALDDPAADVDGPGGRRVKCSTKVSVPLRPSRARPLNTSSIRPEPPAVRLTSPVSRHLLEPFHVPVQSLVPVHRSTLPVAGSTATMCATHAPTGFVHLPLRFARWSGRPATPPVRPARPPSGRRAREPASAWSAVSDASSRPSATCSAGLDRAWPTRPTSRGQAPAWPPRGWRHRAARTTSLQRMAHRQAGDTGRMAKSDDLFTTLREHGVRKSAPRRSPTPSGRARAAARRRKRWRARPSRTSARPPRRSGAGARRRSEEHRGEEGSRHAPARCGEAQRSGQEGRGDPEGPGRQAALTEDERGPPGSAGPAIGVGRAGVRGAARGARRGRPRTSRPPGERRSSGRRRRSRSRATDPRRAPGRGSGRCSARRR